MDKLWPITARAADDGELWLGGCAASTLAAEFGTPLYIFDEATLRTQARAYREALAQHYPGTAQAAYASKAYLCTAIAQLFAEEGLDLDVVSGGELYVALRAGFPPERIHFHGNNKSREELTEALAAGIGRIVVDNFHELAMLAERVAGEQPASDLSFQFPASSFQCRVWLRLSPGVAAHTHAHIQTGHLDTKFGFPIATGDAERAVSLAMQTPGLELIGLHCHIGSQIYEPESLADAAAVLIAFAAEMRDRHGFTLRELSPGGGWGVPMTEDDPAAPVEPYIAALTAAIVDTCRARGLDAAAPGAGAGPFARCACRGGALHRRRAQGDPRRAHLRRRWTAAWRITSGRRCMGRSTRRGWQGSGIRDQAIRGQESGVRGQASELVTIAGRFCESGDILIRDMELPRLEAGSICWRFRWRARTRWRWRATTTWHGGRPSCWSRTAQPGSSSAARPTLIWSPATCRCTRSNRDGWGRTQATRHGLSTGRAAVLQV